MSHSSRLITLRALATARWVMIVLTAALGAVFGGWVVDSPGLHLLGGPINIVGWYVVVAAWAVLNVVAIRGTSRMAAIPAAPGLLLVGDALALSGLLALSGGAANPFTILYFVPIMLATQVSPRWTWGLAAVCMSCFGLLFVVGSGQHSHHFAAHMKGMWLAFAVAGALITFFVHRIAVAIATQRQELFDLREAALRDRQLARIGSLAAGAAHELGTPLATMSVLVGEIVAMNDDERETAVKSIKTELGRCKQIIGAMANSELRADDVSALEVEPWPVDDIRGDLDVDVMTGGSRSSYLAAPRPAVVGIVRELIANARRSDPGAHVSVRIDGDDGDVHLTVEDDGPGMSDEVAAMARDPFFTTREAEGHMGLGLFLAESQARQLGGSLELDTKAGSGTRVSLVLPVVDGAGQ